MQIEAKIQNNKEYLTIKGGMLKSKLSIHKKKDGYHATSAKQNAPLIELLNGLPCVGVKYEWEKSYYGWKIDSGEILTVINAVVRKFE